MTVASASSQQKDALDHKIKRRNLGTAKQVANLLDIPLTTLYDNARAGRIPGSIKIGKRVRFDLDKLDAWLEAGGDKGQPA